VIPFFAFSGRDSPVICYRNSFPNEKAAVNLLDLALRNDGTVSIGGAR
jgi:hypothetical protein